MNVGSRNTSVFVGFDTETPTTVFTFLNSSALSNYTSNSTKGNVSYPYVPTNSTTIS